MLLSENCAIFALSRDVVVVVILENPSRWFRLATVKYAREDFGRLIRHHLATHNTLHKLLFFSNLRKKARAGNFVSKNPSKWGQAVWKCLHCLHPSFMMLLYNTQCSLIRFRTTRSRILKKSLRMQFRPF